VPPPQDIADAGPSSRDSPPAKKRRRNSNDEQLPEQPESDAEELPEQQEGPPVTPRKGKEYECGICPFKCAKSNDLQSHMKVVHEGERYKCDQCGASYTTKRSLQTHIDTKHLGKHRFLCGIDEDDGQGECQFSCNDPGKMKGHKANKHGKGISQCRHCEKKFDNARSLSRHNCQRQKTFQCEPCGRKLFTQKALDEHTATYHGDNPKYVCHLCGQVLGSQQSLRRHEERQH
jgi:KRAB domain-containing zinc finger protein